VATLLVLLVLIVLALELEAMFGCIKGRGESDVRMLIEVRISCAGNGGPWQQESSKSP
jgi:hypothetical protein